jgi:hypothetical protein
MRQPANSNPLKQSSRNMAVNIRRCRPGYATALAMLLSFRKLEPKGSREEVRGVQWWIPGRYFGKAHARSSKATKQLLIIC